eukprot:249968_1
MASEKQRSKLGIVVGTTNKLKIKAIASCFDQDKYNIFGLNEFESAVSEYPVGKQETYQGSLYRAQTAYKQYPNASIWIGVESGFLYDNWQNIPINQVDIVNVIVSIVMLTENTNPNGNPNHKTSNNTNKNDKKQSKFNETCLWSEILECPITSKQRFNQISAPIKHYLSKQT